jgi:hypothetical protein
MYQQIIDVFTNQISNNFVKRTTDHAHIPFAPGNRDYDQFKKDLSNSIEITDPSGTVLTAEEIATLLGTLP